MRHEEELLALIDEYFSSDGMACRDCEHFRRWREPRGEFWGQPVSEEMSSCMALEVGDPYMCPILDDLTRPEDTEDE